MEKDKDSSNVQSRSSNEKICSFCSAENSKYLCPRCRVRYCSVTCYKSNEHLICSEDFFKHCIQEHLNSTPVDSQIQKQMMETLKKIHDESIQQDEEIIDSDDEDEADLASRLESIDLNDADAIWQQLTDAEKAEFESLISSGDVRKILPVWNPWWIQEKILIEELDKSNQQNISYPNLVNNIPDFQTICKVSPSPLIKFNIENVLSSYCFTSRHYNGDYETNSQDCASCLLQLSDNLTKNSNFTNSSLAIEAVVMNSINIMKSSPEDTLLIKSDVKSLTETKQFVLYALSDVHFILCRAKSSGKSQRKNTTNSREESFSKRFPDSTNTSQDFVLTKSILNSAIKKIEFYLSWSNSHYKN